MKRPCPRPPSRAGTLRFLPCDSGVGRRVLSPPDAGTCKGTPWDERERKQGKRAFARVVCRIRPESLAPAGRDCPPSPPSVRVRKEMPGKHSRPTAPSGPSLPTGCVIGSRRKPDKIRCLSAISRKPRPAATPWAGGCCARLNRGMPGGGAFRARAERGRGMHGRPARAPRDRHPPSQKMRLKKNACIPPPARLSSLPQCNSLADSGMYSRERV